MKSDPDFDDCSRDAVQQLFNALGPGKLIKKKILLYHTYMLIAIPITTNGSLKQECRQRKSQ